MNLKRGDLADELDRVVTEIERAVATNLGNARAKEPPLK